ncbi:hypothetical protein [Helicobacter bilis]|uniref:hypothetical protein n=1 Tax=Helicobacter bilis TaxID=37372 RepID=UPI0018F833B9|nr:hypothetical protein [Helicobacter bilis]
MDISCWNLVSKNYALNPAAHPNSAQNLDSIKETHKNPAEVSLSDFCSFQGGGEGSYLEGNDQADTAESTKSTKETTQNLDSLNLRPCLYNLGNWLNDGVVIIA